MKKWTMDTEKGRKIQHVNNNEASKDKDEGGEGEEGRRREKGEEKR